MSKFKFWSILFVLVLLVFAFAGCGGGGGGTSSISSEITSDRSGWDTDPTQTKPEPDPAPEPEPINPDPIQPEPTTPEDPEPVTPEPVQPEPEPEPTPEPVTPEPTTPDAYTDTYDIASILNGEWYSVSGSGAAIGTNKTYHLFLLSLNTSFVGTQITGQSGLTYMTTRQYWECPEDQDYGYLGTSDNSELNLIHIGSNTWEHIASDGTTMTFRFVSTSTVMITSDGTINMNGDTYQVTLDYTIEKKGSGIDNIQDTYDIASVMNGEWYGVEGSGLATGTEGLYSMVMSSISVNIFGTQVANNTLTAYMAHRQRWNCYNQNGQFVTRAVIYRDNSILNMTRIGRNIWEAKAQDGLFLIIQFTSETTALITLETTANVEERDYRYYVVGTIQKYSY